MTGRKFDERLLVLPFGADSSTGSGTFWPGGISGFFLAAPFVSLPFDAPLPPDFDSSSGGASVGSPCFSDLCGADP